MLATVARVVALRRTGLLFCPGGGRALWTGRAQSDTDNMKPLEGVKILDLTRVLAGPFATMNLGDLGAEVIKVERPGAGDDTRTWGPPFVGTESTYFLSVNRNKKSIAVNIKDPKGVKIIKELAAVCDVFVENYVPGKLSAVGLGYEDIDKIAPHIVYCSITGYGQTGPLSQRAGYDAVASAVSGLMHITGPEDGDPVRPGVAMTDLATGLYAYGAIMAGLIQRYKTGKGLFIDCNLLSSQVACLTQVAANYLIGQKEAKRWGTAHGSIVPYQRRPRDRYKLPKRPNPGMRQPQLPPSLKRTPIPSSFRHLPQSPPGLQAFQVNCYDLGVHSHMALCISSFDPVISSVNNLRGFTIHLDDPSDILNDFCFYLATTQVFLRLSDASESPNRDLVKMHCLIAGDTDAAL
ncbi:PREDICTED: succinate--hydroxymethylglutarate CoA-transferase [Odobenus rosmarus divergens]|uniref:Succinate--hydroxymethylglutarate CoA-transferase n=1 Tax=Odobenus rosmarus divergens TaxID=9708 RepID=A0A2U3VMB4_ODORO|nr:PREDICTED: succinate--hydroxymethylglutarate CoA-transferase [Odobenus rosmarus divergens]